MYALPKIIPLELSIALKYGFEPFDASPNTLINVTSNVYVMPGIVVKIL